MHLPLNSNAYKVPVVLVNNKVQFPLKQAAPPMLDMLPTPEAIALLEGYFSDAMEKKHLHSVYTCCGKCSDISEVERARIKSQKNDRREKEGS